MAISHRKRVERARAQHDAASSTFTTWAIANGFGHVRHNDLEAAIAGHPEGVKLWALCRAAYVTKNATETDAVRDGAAWRDEQGRAQLYSRRRG